MKYGIYMPNSRGTPQKCSLCGAKLGNPTFKCEQCDSYFNDKGILRIGDGLPFCPECNTILKAITEDECLANDLTLKK